MNRRLAAILIPVALVAGAAAATTLSTTTTIPNPAPSGVPMPTGDVTSNGHLFHQIVAEDFTKYAASGSWANSTCADAVVYTGATGVPWMSYPSCWLDTAGRPYQAGSVLQVSGGVLDFWLHPVNGHPAGANPSPVFPNGTRYQTYGRYTVRLKQSTTALSDYYMAFLLWPQDGNYQCGESDFPERNLASVNLWAFNHRCVPTLNVDPFQQVADPTAWHTYGVQWEPGKMSFSVDGVSVGVATTGITSSPRRWQLQTESSSNTCEPSCTETGHVQVDWVVAYSY